MAVAAAAWYVILCLLHWLNPRALWLDEYNVFRSVALFAPGDFFREELITTQVFPRLYLFLIHTVAQPFNFHVWSVRFLPFVSMVAAFFVWLKLAGYELKDRKNYFLFVLSWAASVPLIYYASELKQYSMDVLAGSLFLLFIYRGEELKAGSRVLYIAALSLLPFLALFSYPSFLFMGFPLYNLIRREEEGRFRNQCLLVYVFAVLAAAHVFYHYDFKVSGARTQGFDDYFISFASAGEFFKTFGEGVNNLISRWFAEQPRFIKKIGLFFTPFGMICIFVSFFRNFRKDGYLFKSVNTVALALFAELFILGALKKYPFSVPRTSLFYCPVVLLMTIKGIDALRVVHPWISRVILAVYGAFLVFVMVGISRTVFSWNLSAIPKIW